MKKKILFLSYNDFQGGAAIASYNMFNAIPSKKYEQEFNCIIKKTKNNKVKKIKISLFSYVKIIISIIFSQTLFLIFNSKNKIKRSMCLFETGILKNIDFTEIDIVHIQWLYNDVISLDEILKIKKKLVISLHDLWFCNGSFHYTPSNLNVFTKYFEKYLLRKKCKKILSRKDIVFTAPSLWCKNQFLNILKKFNKANKPLPKVHVIGNVIDYNKNKQKKLTIYNDLFPKAEHICLIHYEKKNNFVKAYDHLFNLLTKINQDKKNELKYFVIFGNNTKNFPYKKFDNLIFYDLGFVENKYIDQVYKIANVFVLTSRQETFSQLTADSIINNTPVVAFNCSGHKELIVHKQNGYLVKNYNIKGLIKGIKYFKNKNIKKSDKLKKFSKEKYYNNFLKNIYERNNSRF